MTIKANVVSIATVRGAEQAEIVPVDEGVQINVYLPGNGGAGLFALFPTMHPLDEALAELRNLLTGPALAADIDLTARIPGALAAGSMPRPAFEFKPRASE